MRTLVFGKHGQVGTHLLRSLPPLGETVAVGRGDADLTDPAALARVVRETRPDVVLNAAAYTAVDRAESEPELAAAINSEAPGVMAREAAALGAAFIHYSTDYVFDGTARQPYTEDSPTQPLGVYGRTKLAGEQAVAAAGGNWLVFRTAWVYSLHGHNFLNTMLRLANERDHLRVVDDQVGSPTFAGAIAEGTVAVLEAIQRQGGMDPKQVGVYHMTCAGQTSWCGFARRIFQLAGVDNMQVEAIATSEYPTPAARPAYSVLSNAKLAQVFGVRLPPWEQVLSACIAERELAEQR